MFFLSAIGFIWKCVADYRRLLDRPSRRIVQIILLIGIVLGLVTFIPGITGNLPRYRSLLGPTLFSDALAHLDGTDGWWGNGAFNAVNQATNFMVTVCAVLAAIQIVSCLADFKVGSSVENWKFQAERLKLHTYLSALLLVIAVLEVRAWALYPSFMLKDEHAYVALVGAFTTYLGVMYSVILASAALPVAYQLAARASRISADASGLPPSEASEAGRAPSGLEWRRQQGLELSPTEIMKTVIAVLAPFLAGGVAGLPFFGT